ncbi:MAG TPA: hypothetical protein VKA94_11580, partial [Hyphomicrobiales bacterium]|nr:hypothetical protein [Hyphomicrobiales bacterium]
RREAPAAKANGKRASAGGKTNDKPTIVSAENSEPLAETVSAPPVSNGAGSKSGDRTAPRKNQPRRREKEEPAVVGMGDHVPAFMLIPTRRVR